jgi:hypothetical protein
MEFSSIEQSFRNKICTSISLVPEGIGRFRVFHPFLFDDGDHLSIVLKKENGSWLLTDEGHTFMHLSYTLDEKDWLHGTRQKIIENALSTYNVKDREGELNLIIEDDLYADSLFSFVQALLKVTDINYLTRERARSTFIEDFRRLIANEVSEKRRIFDWFDKDRDPKGNYQVDCRINSMPKPLFIYALQNDDQVKDATISLHMFERWGIPNQTLTIFEDQEKISRKVLARYSDVAGKLFSSIGGDNTQRITHFLHEIIQ